MSANDGASSREVEAASGKLKQKFMDGRRYGLYEMGSDPTVSGPSIV